MKEQYHRLFDIQLEGDDFKKKGLRIRVVKLFWSPTEYTCLTIDQLKTILRLWIKGEEERYPPVKGYAGRWLLFEEIKKVFNEDIK